MMDVGGAASREEKQAVGLKASGATSRGLCSPVKMYRSGMHPSLRFPARWPELKACLPVARRKCGVNGCITLTHAQYRIIEQKDACWWRETLLFSWERRDAAMQNQEVNIIIGVELQHMLMLMKHSIKAGHVWDMDLSPYLASGRPRSHSQPLPEGLGVVCTYLCCVI